MEVVERILSGIVTIVGTVLMNIPGLLDNKIVVDLSDIDYSIEGNINHHTLPTGTINQGVSLRRIVTERPRVAKVDIRPEFVFNQCDSKRLWEGPHKIIHLIVGCPLEAVWNIIRAILSTIANFLLQIDDLFEILAQILVDNLLLETSVTEFDKLSEGSGFGDLINQAQQDVLYRPDILLDQPDLGTTYSMDIDDSDIGNFTQQLASSLPPPLSIACVLSEGKIPGACLIAQILSGVRKKLSERTYTIKGFGVKSHYRSTVKNVSEAATALSSPDPMAYYCGSDVNEFSPDDEYGSHAIALLTDFAEVDRRTLNESFAGLPERPLRLDYKRQCAPYFDIKFIKSLAFDSNELAEISTSHYNLEALPGARIEFGPVLTERSQLLINEIFVCESSRQCNIFSGEMIMRSIRAMCSIIDDIRFRAYVDDNPQIDASLIDAANDAEIILGLGLIALDHTSPTSGRRVRRYYDDDQVQMTLNGIKMCRDTLNNLDY